MSFYIKFNDGKGFFSKVISRQGVSSTIKIDYI